MEYSIANDCTNRVRAGWVLSTRYNNFFQCMPRPEAGTLVIGPKAVVIPREDDSFYFTLNINGKREGYGNEVSRQDAIVEQVYQLLCHKFAKSGVDFTLGLSTEAGSLEICKTKAQEVITLRGERGSARVSRDLALELIPSARLRSFAYTNTTSAYERRVSVTRGYPQYILREIAHYLNFSLCIGTCSDMRRIYIISASGANILGVDQDYQKPWSKNIPLNVLNLGDLMSDTPFLYALNGRLSSNGVFKFKE